MADPDDEVAEDATPTLRNDLTDPHFYQTVLYALGLGLAGALVTVAFIEVLRVVHEALWISLPDLVELDPTSIVYLVPVCVGGGALVGVARKNLGEYPVSLEEALAGYKQNKSFDFEHIPQVIVISLVSLGFGAALGPEAALVALIGGLSSWVAKVITANARDESVMTFVGLAGAMGALFGTAGAAGLGLADGSRARSRIWVLVPAVAAAGAGALVFRYLASGPGYFSYEYPPYSFEPVDLAWAVLVTAAGTFLAAVFLFAAGETRRLTRRFDNQKVILSAAGGLGLALLATTSPLVLFSGHEGIQRLINENTTDSTAFLVWIAIAKAVAATLLLATGWKGGRFFPLMFAGAAAGLALSHAVPGVDPMVGLAVGMTSAVAVVIRRPIVAGALMIFIFPREMYPVVIVGALVAGVFGAQLIKRFPGLLPDEAAVEAPT